MRNDIWRAYVLSHPRLIGSRFTEEQQPKFWIKQPEIFLFKQFEHLWMASVCLSNSPLTKWRLADNFYKWGLPSRTQFIELQQGRDVENGRLHKMGLMLPNYFLGWGSQRASSDDEGLWIFSDAAAAATLPFFSWAGGNSAILRGTGKKILFSFAHSSCILRIVLLWDAPPERTQWWWCQGTSASKKQTNWNRGNLDAQKIRQEIWLDYPLVTRPILVPDSEYELISGCLEIRKDGAMSSWYG